MHLCKCGQSGLLCLLIMCCLSGCALGGQSYQRYLSIHKAELTVPASADERLVRIEIESGTPARVIGQQLADAGLIQDDQLFEAYIRVNGLSHRLSAGVFVFSPSMTPLEIINQLQGAQAPGISLTIPEGWRSGQIIDKLKTLGPMDELSISEYEAVVSSGRLPETLDRDFTFLATKPINASLEGYLFPATYELPVDSLTSEAVLTRQLSAFRSQVVPLYEEARSSSATDMDLFTVLTIASIVEREAVIADERATIAGVYLNRLRQGMKLEADPTVQYAMGYQPDTDQWWKTPVFLEEYSSVISAYNTYLYSGLPPGPISNPGLESIRAVLFPEVHSYLYFVALPEEDGRHVFAQTFAEHERNVQNYLAAE